MSRILNFLNTITSQYLSLSKTKNENRESKLIFENLFYHLRPGTYDITVKRAISDIKVRKINNLDFILSYKNFSKTLLSTKEIETIDNF